MPRISEFYGIVIEMYFRDHPPPHFHARYSGEEAVIARAERELGPGSESPRLGRNRAAAMSALVRIADVRPLEGHWVRLWFTDGVVKDVDLSEALAGGGVFDAIYRDREVFEQVRVNPESRTIEWPGEIDLDPDVLYGTFEPEGGIRIERRLVKEPAGQRS